MTSGESSAITTETLARAAHQLRRAGSVVVLTGAGISAESGIPTFREAQTGLWARFDASELATPEAFERDPQLVWSWYAWRRRLVREAQPNPGHLALAALETRVALTLVTQNVDGLHQRAGSRRVIEYHGSLMRTLCSREGIAIDHAVEDETLPRCQRCGALGRPGVVWFGEPIAAEALERSASAARECKVFMSVGTSALVYPAAGLAEAALRAGAYLIEVNPDTTPLTRLADAVLRGPSGTVLPALLDAMH